mmetsp:Transcript_53709/g.136281  ORF Transcript_53709/g.136281 Transcript_53709/m.136281 type:complete len:226 (-) Transcript_53709:735-1412(-)
MPEAPATTDAKINPSCQFSPRRPRSRGAVVGHARQRDERNQPVLRRRSGSRTLGSLEATADGVGGIEEDLAMDDVQKPLVVHLLWTLTLQSIGLPHRIAPIRQTLDQVPALLGPTLVASRLVDVLEGESRVLLPRSRRRCQKALLLLRPGSRAHREIQKSTMPDFVLVEKAVVVVHQASAAGRQLLLGHGHAGDRLDQLFEGGLRTTREAGRAHQRGGSLENGRH